MENKNYVGRIVLVKQVENTSLLIHIYNDIHEFEQAGATLIETYEELKLYVNHNIIQTPKGETLFIRID